MDGCFAGLDAGVPGVISLLLVAISRSFHDVPRGTLLHYMKYIDMITTQLEPLCIIGRFTRGNLPSRGTRDPDSGGAY